MRTSETIGKIAPAIVKAQAKMGHAIKNATNPHFKNDYADLAACIDSSRAILAENGLAVIHGAESDSTEAVTVTARVIHESGEWIESSLMLRPSKNDPQGVGSAITYGRRYTLTAILGMGVADDDGNAASGPTQNAPSVRRETAKQNGTDQSGPFVAAVKAWSGLTDGKAIGEALRRVLASKNFKDKASVPNDAWPLLVQHVENLKDEYGEYANFAR